MHFHTKRTIDNFYKNIQVSHDTECWNWTGRLNQDGYGCSSIFKGRIKGAHRVSVWIDGRDPTGHFVCHTCDNPACVNPSHLVIADAAWNNADKRSKGRHHQPKGSKNPQAKLDEATARKIKAETVVGYRVGYNNGSNVKEIAAKYNVHPETVRFIARGITWKHI